MSKAAMVASCAVVLQAIPSQAFAEVLPPPSPYLTPAPGQPASDNGVAPAPPASAAPKEGWSTYYHWWTRPDGKRTMQIFTEPMFHLVGGTWKPIDTTVHASGNADHPAEALGTIRPVHFGDAAGRVITIDLDHGPVVLSAAGLDLIKPTIQGSTVTYRNVAQDTDLVYHVTPGAIKEELVLRSSRAPQSFSFHLSDPDHQLGAAHELPGEEYVFDATTAPGLKLGLGRPLAYQPTTDGTPSLGEAGSAHSAVSKAGDGFDVQLSLDSAWVKGRAFPVVLDPQITFPNANGSITSGDDSNGNGGNYSLNQDDSLTAGTNANVWRSFVKFDLSGIPWNSTVVPPSTLGIYKYSCLADSGPACGPATHTVEIHRLNGPWSASSTWNQLSAITDGGVQASGVENSTTINVWHTFDLSGQVQRWVRGQDADNGVVIKVQDETLQQSGPFYYSDRTTNTSLRPYLTVNFTINGSHGYPPAPPGQIGQNAISSVGSNQAQPLPRAPYRAVFFGTDHSLLTYQGGAVNGAPSHTAQWVSLAAPYNGASQTGAFVDSDPDFMDVTSNGDTAWGISGGGTVSTSGQPITTWKRSGLTWTQQSSVSEPQTLQDNGPVAVFYDSRSGHLYSAYTATVISATSGYIGNKFYPQGPHTDLFVNWWTISGSSLTIGTETDEGVVNNLSLSKVEFVRGWGGSVGLVMQDGSTMWWLPGVGSTWSTIGSVDASSLDATSWQLVADDGGNSQLVASTSSQGIRHWSNSGGNSWTFRGTVESGFHRLSLATDGSTEWLATDEGSYVGLRTYAGSWGGLTQVTSSGGNPALPARVDPHSIPIVWDGGGPLWFDRYDNAPPLTTIVTPAIGSPLSGTIVVTASSTDASLGAGGVARVDFYVDRGAGYIGYLGSSSTPDGSGNFNYTWNTAENDSAWTPFGTGNRLWQPGAYEVYAVAYDWKGNSQQSPRSLTYLNTQDLGVHPYRPNYQMSLGGGIQAVVNLANGNLNVSQGDLVEPTVVGPLTVGRSYNSLDSTDNGFGSGWAPSVYTSMPLVFRKLIDHSGDANYPSGTVELIDAQGGQHWYFNTGQNGGYESFLGDMSRLSHNGDGSWSLTMNDGTRFDFSSGGSPSAITPASVGTSKTFTYAYNTSGQLSTVTEPTGRFISFGYTGADITTLYDFTSTRNWSYGYTGTDLAAINDPAGRQTRFGYDSNHHLNYVSDPRGLQTFFDYDGSNRVYQIRERHNGSDLTTTIDYSNPSAPAVTSFRGNLAGCTGSCSAYFRTVYQMDSANRLIQITEQLPSGSTVSSHLSWDSGLSRPRNLLTSKSDFYGNTVYYGYDAMGDMTSESDAVGSSSFGFDGGYAGLAGEYYPNMTLTPSAGFPVRRVDSSVNFNWNGGSPAPGIPGTQWSARWTGWVNIPADGSYTFYTTSDDGVALQLDGRLLINDWTDHASTTDTSPSLYLAAGLHDLGLAYYQNQGGSLLTLGWSGPGFGNQPIPQGNLQPGLHLATSATDHNSHTVSMAYDDPFQRHVVQRQETNRDLSGNVTTLTTQFSYIDPATGQTDVYGRLHSKTPPNGVASSSPASYATTYTYYADGATASNPCPGGATLNQGGLLESTTFGTSGAITAQTKVYDDRGNVVASTDGKGTTCNTYDAANRLLTTQPPDRISAISYQYDADGNLQQTSDPVKGTSSYTWDDLNRLLTSSDVFGGSGANYSYDSYTATSEIDHRTDAAGSLTSTFDQLGRLVAQDYTPTGGSNLHFAYTYDSNGRLWQSKYPNGITATRVFDALGRLTSLSDLTSGGAAIASYTDVYDPAGRRTSETDPFGSWSYSYDSVGRIQQVRDPLGFVRSYKYDLDSNRTESDLDVGLHWARGTTVEDTGVSTALNYINTTTQQVTLPFSLPFYGSTYNSVWVSVNGYISLTQNNNTQPDPVATAGIFPFAKSLKVGTGAVMTRQDPLVNPTRFLIRWKVQDPNAAVTDTTNYYDFAVWIYNDGHMSFDYGQMPAGASGARVGYSKGGGSNNLDYALIGGMDQQAVPANAPSVEVTPHAAQRSGPYTFDALDRLSPDSSHVYDAAGNTTALPGATYTYDGRNLLTQATSGSSSDAMSYDGEGREISATTGGVTQNLRYDGPGDSGEAFETNTSGTVTKSTLMGAEGMVMTYASGVATYYLHDPRGDTRLQVNSSAQITNQPTWDEFGNRTGGSAITDGFVGGYAKRTELGTGTVIMGARAYDSQLGRFLQKDPVDGGSANAYDYANQNPVTGMDLSGRAVGQDPYCDGDASCKEYDDGTAPPPPTSSPSPAPAPSGGSQARSATTYMNPVRTYMKPNVPVMRNGPPKAPAWCPGKGLAFGLGAIGALGAGLGHWWAAGLLVGAGGEEAVGLGLIFAATDPLFLVVVGAALVAGAVYLGYQAVTARC
jgi:RHS repeat-associated protein